MMGRLFCTQLTNLALQYRPEIVEWVGHKKSPQGGLYLKRDYHT